MRLRLQSKGVILLLSLFFLFLVLQFFFFFSLKKSLLFSSFLALCLMTPLLFLLVRSIFKPILNLTRKTMESVSGRVGHESQVYSGDEFGDLSKAIAQVSGQLKKTIEEITREKGTLQAILGGMAEGVLLVDDRDRILLVNEALQRLFAISSEVAEKTTLEVIRNVDLEEAIQEVLRHGIQKNFEITLPVSGEKTFEVNVSGIPSASTEMKGAIAVFHDITRLKELERARKDFVANVSHELRTPLAAIKGYVETLLEGAWREEVALSFIQVIQRHTDRLTRIVEDLLTLSRIEARGFKMESEQTPISDLIDDVFDVVKESASKKKITLLKGDLAPTLLLRADPKHLEQVLINLLDNGIKYTPEDGTLEISVTERKDEFLFAIKDNGIGIPKEDLPRIFERFYRVDKGRSKELGGTGLGLSIVKHIVQAHHGRAWAESQLGKGSTFYFTLPKAPQGQ